MEKIETTYVNLEPVDMEEIKAKIQKDKPGQLVEQIQELRNQPVDLNVMTVVEYQDQIASEEYEEFTPTPLGDDEVVPLDIALKPVEGEQPDTTAGDILYTPNRKMLISDNVAKPKKKFDEDGYAIKQTYTEPIGDNANLVTSECMNGNHAPVIDIDLPIEVYPSSQLGHYHLYVNKEMTWDEYVDLLTALAKAGIVEENYANASIANGFSAVRPVGVQKVEAPRGAYVLRENAEFRKLIYELRQLLAYQTTMAEQNVDWDLVQERNQLAETAQELYQENQRIQHEANQLREELNRARLQQANNAAISWT